MNQFGNKIDIWKWKGSSKLWVAINQKEFCMKMKKKIGNAVALGLAMGGYGFGNGIAEPDDFEMDGTVLMILLRKMGLRRLSVGGGINK